MIVRHLSAFQPDEYFSVFSLRNWAKLRGDILTTELVRVMAGTRMTSTEATLGIYTREGLHRG
jgi:hypothetical protein